MPTIAELTREKEAKREAWYEAAMQRRAARIREMAQKQLEHLGITDLRPADVVDGGVIYEDSNGIRLRANLGLGDKVVWTAYLNSENGLSDVLDAYAIAMKMAESSKQQQEDVEIQYCPFDSEVYCSEQCPLYVKTAGMEGCAFTVIARKLV